MKRALILEDYEPSRELLCGALMKAYPQLMVAEAATVAAALRHVDETDFDLALIDLNLPDGSGIELIRHLQRRPRSTYCVVTTTFDDDEHLFQSLQAGADGYLLKGDKLGELIRHLRGIIDGQPPLSAAMSRRMLSHFGGHRQHSASRTLELTQREREVLELIARGESRKAIARSLGISPHTANDHVKSIYRKLNVSSGTEAARVAFEQGIGLGIDS